MAAHCETSSQLHERQNGSRRRRCNARSPLRHQTFTAPRPKQPGGRRRLRAVTMEPLEIARIKPAERETASDQMTRREVVFDVDKLSVSYGRARAIKDADLEIHRNTITALIGPSGCGKSTFLRCLNRMNDLIPNVTVEGTLRYHGVDIYGDDVDPIEVRRRIGMVFQRPNPFPKSIFDNVAFAPKVLGMRDAI